MSSTNRGSQRSPADYYATPKWCVYRLLDRLVTKHDIVGKRWLEPAAGDGAVIRAVNKFLQPFDGTPQVQNWKSIELRGECRSALAGLSEVVIGDALTVPWPDADIIITNPPFSLAEEFAEKMAVLPSLSILLLRLNFLGSERRSRFLQEFMPDVYVLPNRPSFTGNGTDSIEYAWFVWPPYSKRFRTGHVEILDTTPASAR